jgi:hypothetical protein
MPPENDTQFPATSSGASRDASSSPLRAMVVVGSSPVLPVEPSNPMEVLSPWDEPDMHAGNAHMEDRNRNEHNDPATSIRPSILVEGSDEALSLELNESSSTGLEQAPSEHSFRIQALPIPARNLEHEREASAEEVLQASLSYDRSNSPAHVPGSRPSLYPSLNGLEQDLLSRDGREEITELVSVPLYAAASIQEPTGEATILATAEQDEELLEMKRAAYDGGISFHPAPFQDQEATVIAIADDDVHPSDISDGAVQAEFIGHNNALFDHSSSEPLSFDQDSSYTAVEAESADDTATEATVIESAPLSLEGDDLPLWKVTEEARVLATDVTTPLTDRKPAAVEYTDDEEAEDFAVADQEAEIVEIQEEAHPLELSGAAAEAELVGTDDNFHVAVLAPQRHAVAEAFIEEDGGSTYYQENEIIEEAVVIGESDPRGQDSEDGGVCASLVEADYSAAPSFPTKPAHPLDSEFEDQSIPRDGVAMPVDTYDDSWVHNNTFGSNDSSLPVAMPPVDPPASGRAQEREDSGLGTPGWLREEPIPSPRAFGSAGRNVSNSSGAASDSSNPSQRVVSRSVIDA